MGTGNFLLNRTGGYDPQAQRSVRPVTPWGPIYVLADGSDLLNGWIHLFFRNLLFLLENRHTLLTFLHYTISQIVDEPLKTISPLIMKEQPAYPRAVLIFCLFAPHVT